MRNLYQVTVTPRFPAWNEGPFTVNVYATSKSAASATVRKQYANHFDGGASYRADTAPEGAVATGYDDQ